MKASYVDIKKSHGNGLAAGLGGQFLFATGIENSYPVINGPDGAARRVDEMEKCGHYTRWREDFAAEARAARSKSFNPFGRTIVGFATECCSSNCFSS